MRLWRSGNGGQCRGGLLLAAAWMIAIAARADRVELTDGRVLEGRFARLPGVAVDPLGDSAGPSGGESILMCDDELTRTMVAKRRVAQVDEAPLDPGMERIAIPQRVPEDGRRVMGIGSILAATPFDAFGRRILSLATASGRVDVVQGITEITPRWVRVEGIHTEKPLLLDMRLATSSIPREVLAKIVSQQVDRSDSQQRLRVVRLLLQAERYDDARRELDAVLEAFPELNNLAQERRSLAKLSAVKLLDEILMRGRVGQDRLALKLLDAFPADDADGETLEAVREARDAYRSRRELAGRLVSMLREMVGRLDDDDEETRRAAEAMVEEMEREMSFSTLDRLATFERVGTDAGLPPDRAGAIAINGWLQGAAAGNDNLKVALSAVRVRGLLRDYLRAADEPARNAAWAALRNEEAFDAGTLAGIAAAMRPPLDPPPATSPGLHEISARGIDGRDVRCLVQLPPEYDPLRRYPVIVSLHASWSTPLNQIEWWAGMPGADGLRLGQATRHGAIVVAPAWAREQQSAYDYSAAEHAVVLASLREAMRRFSIDSDRVFLSGHSMGGDAAWDIGLAHPDLWAGVIVVSAAAGRYVNHYWPNARGLPIYVVGGELDAGTLQRNAMDLDRYLSKGFDVTYVEYRGRGHEHFSDETLRIFDWMARRKRGFFPRTIDVLTMRPWDRFFWWLEMEGAPPRTMALPEQWPLPPGTRPFGMEGKVNAGNAISVHCGAERVRVWLSPELVDFRQPLTVTADGRVLHKGPITADERLLLEDLRLRADRQHPFWAMVEAVRGPKK